MLSRLLQTAGQGLPQQAGNPDLSYLMRGGQPQPPQQGPQQTEGLGSLPGFAGQVYMDAISKMDAKLAKEEENAKRKLMEASQKRAQLKPPQPKQRGLADLLPVLALLAGGKLFNANSRDMSGLLGGFMKGRNDYDQQHQAGEMARYEAERGALGDEMNLANMQYGWAKGDRNEFQQRRDAERGIMIADRRGAQKSASDELGELRNRYNQANTPDEKRYFGGLLVKRGDIPVELVESAAKRMEDEGDFNKRVKVGNLRSALLGKLMPYTSGEEERTKFAKWASSLSEEELNVKVGQSEAELLAEARRKTENEMRAGKVAGQEARNKDILASADYKGKRSQMLVKELAVFDDVTAMQLAKGYAYVDGIASLIGDRSRRQELDTFKANSANASKVLDNTRMHMNAVRESAQKVRGRMEKLRELILGTTDEAERSKMTDALTGEMAMLRGLQAAFKDYQDVYTKAEKELSSAAPSPGVSRGRSFPAPSIDVSGGAAALNRPMTIDPSQVVPESPKNSTSRLWEAAKSEARKRSAKSKPQPTKSKGKTIKTKSGNTATILD